jgi:hypothetical protein
METKHDYYKRLLHYRNSTSQVLDHLATHTLKHSPSETSMSRLPEVVGYGPDFTDLWYSSSGVEEAQDSSCIILPHEVSFERDDGFDEEAGLEATPANASTARSGPRVRFSDAPPCICCYEKPGADCFNQLYYTVHDMQKMQDEFFLEQVEQQEKMMEPCDASWSEDEDSD